MNSQEIVVFFENAIVYSIKELDKNKKEIAKKVEVDLKLMVDTHEKLKCGILVDQHIVSNLLLGGVLNILNQHDTIEEINKRVEVVEQISLTDKLRIEALENWALKQADNLKVLSEKVSKLNPNDTQGDAADQENLMKRMKEVEKDFNSLKANLKGDQDIQCDDKTEVCLICEHCDHKFNKAIDLEKHMEEQGSEMKFTCEVCAKVETKEAHYHSFHNLQNAFLSLL